VGATTATLATGTATVTHTAYATAHSEDGTSNWTFDVCDNAGNCATQKTATTKVDTTAPTMNALSSACSTTGTNGWCRGNNASNASNTANPGSASITWTAGSDAHSGLARYERSTATGTAITSPQSDTTDGTETWQIRAVDVAGNVSAYQSVTIKLDRTTPTTSSSTACTNNGSNGWCKGNGSNGGYQVYNTSATDATSGSPTATAGTADGQTWTTALGDVNTTWTDAAGNVAVSPTRHIQVDVTNPGISVSGGAGYNAWCNCNPSMTLGSSDDYSGVATNYYATASGASGWVPWTSGPGSFTFATAQEGASNVAFLISDNAGNQTSAG
jgi:hypothetical protein